MTTLINSGFASPLIVTRGYSDTARLIPGCVHPFDIPRYTAEASDIVRNSLVISAFAKTDLTASDLAKTDVLCSAFPRFTLTTDDEAC